VSGRRSGKAPQNDKQLVRDLVQRMDDLEKKTTVRIGAWVIRETEGELVAVMPGRDPVPLTERLAAEVVDKPTRVQRVLTMIGSPTGGNWRLIYRGDTTSNLTYNESPADIRTALIALRPEYTVLDFEVTGANGGPWTLTLPPGSLAWDTSTLTGGTNPDIIMTPA
jgi:hypothetical protein